MDETPSEPPDRIDRDCSFFALTSVNALIAFAWWQARAEYHYRRGAPNDYHVAACHSELVYQALQEGLL